MACCFCNESNGFIVVNGGEEMNVKNKFVKNVDLSSPFSSLHFMFGYKI